MRNPSEVLKTRIRTRKQSSEKKIISNNNNEKIQKIENNYENLNMKKIMKNLEPKNNRNLLSRNNVKEENNLYNKIIDLYSGFRTNLLYALPSDWLKFLSYEMITKTFFGISIGQGKNLK